MTTHFPTVKHGKGYDRDEVEQFLEHARVAYDTGDAEALTADEIRTTSFGMRRGGYSPSHVDAALERLEDAFARRERDAALAQSSQEEWVEEARQVAQVILNRLSRPEKHRFRRVGPITQGYKRSDVDDFSQKIVRYFTVGTPLTVERVRTAVFTSERGGYDEAQVDAVLDGVIRTMLAVH